MNAFPGKLTQQVDQVVPAPAESGEPSHYHCITGPQLAQHPVERRTASTHSSNLILKNLVAPGPLEGIDLGV